MVYTQYIPTQQQSHRKDTRKKKKVLGLFIKLHVRANAHPQSSYTTLLLCYLRSQLETKQFYLHRPD